jgi:chromosome partitioning protein
MRTIAIINQKGGCGKTTTSINLAACLARLGQKTLLVDMDPQGHCGVGLAVPEDQIERTIYDTLLEDCDVAGGRTAKIAEVVWQIASDFDLAPSNIKLAAFEQVFAGRAGRDDRLTKAIAPVKNTYQWCIVDCPPSVGLITFNALKACDEVVVPVETGYFSLHGLAKMMETLELMKERTGRDVLIRVLPTLYDTRTKLAREVLSELRAKFRDYLMESTVNFNTKLKEAASFGQPITEYDPGSRGYKDFVNLARELMGHRPVDMEPTPSETLSRPAELVQRAKQLAQLANFQFGAGRGVTGMTQQNVSPTGPITTSPGGETRPALRPEPAISATSPSRVIALGLDSSEADLLDETPISTQRDNGRAPAGMNGMSGMGGMSGMAEAAGRTATLSLAQPTALQKPVPDSSETDRKIEAFYGVKQTIDGVIFNARFEGARRVLIAGDFNNWSPMSTPMLNKAAGAWTTQLPLFPGRYRYRFIVDGQWMTDPHNTYVETNQFGELNNIVEVA